MFYEKKVDSRTQLLKELRIMDSDAGVRLHGHYEGKKCFVFISRSGERYAVMLYSIRRGKEESPGRRLLAGEFEGLRELEKFLDPMVTGGVRAVVY